MGFDDFDNVLGRRARSKSDANFPALKQPQQPGQVTSTSSVSTSPRQSNPGASQVPNPNIATRAAILVVDDDEAILSSLEAILGATYNVRTANSARVALDLLDDSIRAVILDVRMPDNDGFWFCDQAKARYPFIPILFHSAYQDAKNPYAIINEHRPFAYLRKDGDIKKLISVLAGAVASYSDLVDARNFAASLRNRMEK